MITITGKTRGDAAEFHRGTQERPAYARAIRGVIRCITVSVAKGDGAEYAAMIDELGSQNRPIRDFLPLPEFFLVNDGKAVTAAQVEGKVDVPTKDFHQLHDQVIREPGVLTVLEQ